MISWDGSPASPRNGSVAHDRGCVGVSLLAVVPSDTSVTRALGFDDLLSGGNRTGYFHKVTAG